MTDSGLWGVASYCEPGRGGGLGLEEASGLETLGVAVGCLAAPGGGFAYRGGSREKCSCIISNNSRRLQP